MQSKLLNFSILKPIGYVITVYIALTSLWTLMFGIIFFITIPIVYLMFLLFISNYPESVRGTIKPDEYELIMFIWFGCNIVMSTIFTRIILRKTAKRFKQFVIGDKLKRKNPTS